MEPLLTVGCVSAGSLTLVGLESILMPFTRNHGWQSRTTMTTTSTRTQRRGSSVLKPSNNYSNFQPRHLEGIQCSMERNGDRRRLRF